MTLIETQKQQLKALAQQADTIYSANLDIDAYLEALCEQSFEIARIVHHGRQDQAGRMYIFHPVRVAAKASTALGYCARILHDAVEDGKEQGVTIAFLREEMMFPMVLVQLVNALTRREDESYTHYLRRVSERYLAAKAKIDDTIDNSDISRFNQPGRSDQIRCASYLEKAWTLKSNPDFQDELPFDYINELLGLAEISPMLVGVGEAHDDGEVMFQRMYFGYEGHQHRRYSLTFNACTDQQTGSTVMQITTLPAKKSYMQNHLYQPRRMELKFDSRGYAEDYIGHVMARIRQCKHMKLIHDIQMLDRSPLSVAMEEMEMLNEINRFYKLHT
jgi:hypothetical protein